MCVPKSTVIGATERNLLLSRRFHLVRWVSKTGATAKMSRNIETARLVRLGDDACTVRKQFDGWNLMERSEQGTCICSEARLW